MEIAVGSKPGPAQGALLDAHVAEVIAPGVVLLAVAEGFGGVRGLSAPQAAVAGIRDAQKTFLKVNGKLPDFIDVGIDPWFAAYDWHVRWQQPLVLGRDAAGRYTLALMQTLLVLHPESPATFMSLPYDGR